MSDLYYYMLSMVKISRKDRAVDINDDEWEAISKGAIGENNLLKILNNTDLDKLRERATPRSITELSTAKQNKIAQMKASGNYTLVEIAQAVGVSTSTVNKYL